MKHPQRLLTLIFCSFLVVACASHSPKVKSDLGIKGAPDWVNEGTQAVDDKNGRFLYGVGFAEPMGNESLQIAAADARARAELAKIMSSYVSQTMSDYMATAGDSVAANLEQSIQSSTEVVLNGVKMKAHWRHKKSGKIYSIAELDLKNLDQAIDNADKLSADFKNYYNNQSSANFERFVEGAE